VIASKHGWDAIKVRNHFPKMVMDVCDDHFGGAYDTHYKVACMLADAVTCNSETMRAIIKTHTDVDAVVIDDPYEDIELEPRTGEGVLWFGHSSNMPDLENIRDQIKYPLTIINSSNYTPQTLDAALKACRCVVIPTGYKQAKSANRAIRSIRYGKFPVCGAMPAHEELGLGLDDFFESLDEAMTNDMRPRILQLQDLVRDKFNPEKIADQWWGVMREA
jgi:hypothetical protein